MWNASSKDGSALCPDAGKKQGRTAQRDAAPGTTSVGYQTGVLSSLLVWAAGLQHGHPLSKVPK